MDSWQCDDCEKAKGMGSFYTGVGYTGVVKVDN